MGEKERENAVLRRKEGAFTELDRQVPMRNIINGSTPQEPKRLRQQRIYSSRDSRVAVLSRAH